MLARAQLCGMFAAGYSAKVTEEDKQNVVPTFENFADGDLFTVGALQGEGGSGGVGFKCHGFQY